MQTPWDEVYGGITNRFGEEDPEIDRIAESLDASDLGSNHSSSTTGEHVLDMGSISTDIMYSVAGQVFESQRENVKSVLSVYATIDLIRPYFDVEPKDVAQRLAYSLYPRPHVAVNEDMQDLYGPLMLALTLAAILLLGMQNSGTTVQQGTLIGTSFAVCFTYWFLASGLFWFGAYICSWNIRIVTAVSLTGYALTGYCLALFSNAFAVPASLSWIVLVVFGGLSSATLGLTFFSNIRNQRNGALAGAAAGGLHFLFLVYLHYAYVRIYEDVDHNV